MFQISFFSIFGLSNTHDCDRVEEKIGVLSIEVEVKIISTDLKSSYSFAKRQGKTICPKYKDQRREGIPLLRPLFLLLIMVKKLTLHTISRIPFF